MDISKSDWKLFQQKLPDWQENYMEKLCREYIRLLTEDTAPSERFWALDKRIKADRRKPGVILEMRKSNLIYNMAALIRDGVIGFEDMKEFSDDLQDRVRFLVERSV